MALITYVIQPGDTLSGLAERFLGRASYMSYLLLANPQIENPDVLFAGDELHVPVESRIPKPESRIADWTEPPRFVIETHKPFPPGQADVWTAFLNARSMAIEQFHRAGRSYAEITSMLSFSDVNHAERIHRGIQPYIREIGQ